MAESLSENSPLVSFYRGAGSSVAPHAIEEIWAYDHRRLEVVHDYIQWLFPIPEPSRFNPDAPTLSAVDAATFRADRALRMRLRRSLAVMLDFYGLAQNAGVIERGAEFAVRVQEWLTPLNHNYLRLTRIIQCLHQCGLDTEAHALLACLEDIAAHEGKDAAMSRALEFWRGAVRARRL